jgi:hypothetical protein
MLSSAQCCVTCQGQSGCPNCSSSYIDPLSSQCRNLFTQTCITNPSTTADPDSQYTEAWSDPSQFCQQMLIQNVQSSYLSGNIDAANWARLQMSTLFETFPWNQRGTFSPILQQACQVTPGACDTALIDVCASYTRDDLSVMPGILPFCGCYLLDVQYSRYETLYGLPRECDPLCARLDVVPGTILNGLPQFCNQTVCIIDNVNISLTGTQAGGFNFEQACGGCSGASSCVCIISDVTLDYVNSRVGETTISNQCTGGGSGCYMPDPYNPQGPAIQVSCQDPFATTETTSQSSNQLIAFLVILLLIVILALFIAFTIYLERSTPKNITVSVMR